MLAESVISGERNLQGMSELWTGMVRLNKNKKPGRIAVGFLEKSHVTY